MWVEARLHEQQDGTVSKQPAKINQAKLTLKLQPCFRCLRLRELLYHCFPANPLKGTDLSFTAYREALHKAITSHLLMLMKA